MADLLDVGGVPGLLVCGVLLDLDGVPRGHFHVEVHRLAHVDGVAVVDVESRAERGTRAEGFPGETFVAVGHGRRVRVRGFATGDEDYSEKDECRKKFVHDDTGEAR